MISVIISEVFALALIGLQTTYPSNSSDYDLYVSLKS